MFERRRARRAEATYRAALADWQRERDGVAAALTLAETFQGEPSRDLLLHAGEAVYATITNVGLVEERRGPGTWQGGSSGVSVPVGTLGGRTIRYHVGGTRGHYVQGVPHPTAIDTGTVVITDQRMVFRGHAQTRECLYAKLLGYESSDDGSTTFSVSNRQKPVTIHYGPALNEWVRLRLDLAVAHARGEVPALVERIQQQLAAVDGARPAPPPAPSRG